MFIVALYCGAENYNGTSCIHRASDKVTSAAVLLLRLAMMRELQVAVYGRALKFIARVKRELNSQADARTRACTFLFLSFPLSFLFFLSEIDRESETRPG